MRIIRLLAFLAGLLPAVAAAQVSPQFPQTIPPNTALGRLGVGPGPVEPIPFSVLASQLLPNAGLSSANKVYASPASGAPALPTMRALVPADLPSILPGITLNPTAIANLAFNINSPNAIGNPASGVATLARIFTGSNANPITTPLPSVGISRYEAITTDTEGLQNPALYVESFGNNVSNIGSGIIAQTAGIVGSATQTATGFGDAVGVSGVGTNSGTSGRTAFGGFFSAKAAATGIHAYSIEMFTANNSGANYPLTPGSVPASVGMHIGGGGSLNTAGIWIGNNGAGAQFDAGIYFSPGSLNSNAIVDDSSSAQSIQILGSHTIGLNLSGGTFSSSAILTPGFAVGPSGTVSVALAPTSGWTNDETGSTVTIANGANAAMAAGNGLIVVEDSVNAHVAEYLCGAAACVLVATSGPAWVAPTTTPAAGKLSVAFSGAAYAIYNNEGASETVTVHSVRMKVTP